MSDEDVESNSVSPVVKADWFSLRWGREDQRGNGNLMTRGKVLEATRLINTNPQYQSPLMQTHGGIPESAGF
jgi:hypothetical protein